MANTDIVDQLQGIILIYFDGCPHLDEVRLELKTLCVKFQEVCQNHLEHDDPLQKYSSPTIICNGELVIGTGVGGAASCTSRSAIDYVKLRSKILKLYK